MKKHIFILFVIISLLSSCKDSGNVVAQDTRDDLIITSKLAMQTPYVGVGPQWGGYDEINSIIGTDTLSSADWSTLFNRVEFMRPGLIRVMGSQGWNYMVNGEYNPQKSAKILFKILDFCQSKDIKVMYGEWGEKALPNGNVDTLWLDRSVNFLDYLINTKGYTCLKYYNMCNEPAGSWSSIGGDYDLWRKTYTAIFKRLAAKNLTSRIIVIAPDVSIANGLDVTNWLVNARLDFGDQIGAYDIHAYPTDDRVKDGSFLNQIMSYRKIAPPNDDFIIGELGYKYDPSSTLGIENTKRISADPYASDDSNMMIYDAFYGIDIANIVVQSMNAGSNGIILWNLDDAMYLLNGKLKRWGFWNVLGNEKFGSNDEKIRPWFYPISLICRYFPNGATIYKATLPDKKGVQAIAAIKDGRYTILVLNYHTVSYSVNLKMESGVLLSKAKCYNYVATSTTGANFQGTVDANGFPTPYATQNIDLTNRKSFSLPLKALSFTLITTME